MPDLQEKIKAIRHLRRLSQAQTAHQAHISLKTYQRKEAGSSAISDEDLAQLCIPFQCTREEIQNFDLESNTFSHPEKLRVRSLEVENRYLKSELQYLRQLLDGFLNQPHESSRI